MSDSGGFNGDLADLRKRLIAPFGDTDVKFKPGMVKGNRALALAYVDARMVEDRLDDVFGVDGWQDEYQFLEDGTCLCRLRVRINGEWVEKMDIGGQSKQPEEGNRRKSAISDALKRAAVKYGIGRYLYRAKQQWADYDPQRKQFTSRPRLDVPQPARQPAHSDAGGHSPAYDLLYRSFSQCWVQKDMEATNALLVKRQREMSDAEMKLLDAAIIAARERVESASKRQATGSQIQKIQKLIDDMGMETNEQYEFLQQASPAAKKAQDLTEGQAQVLIRALERRQKQEGEMARAR